MNQTKDYVIVNIPTIYTHSPPYSLQSSLPPSPILYSLPPSPILYNLPHSLPPSPSYSLPPSPTNDSSTNSSPIPPSPSPPIQSPPILSPSIPSPPIPSPPIQSYTNLRYRRKLYNRHLYTIQNQIEYKDNDNDDNNYNIKTNINNDCFINIGNVENIKFEDENYANYKTQSKISNYTRSFRKFIGKQQIINNDNQEYV